MTHDERLSLAHEIAAQLRVHYGEDLLALGLYGSLARGTDGLYSDIEMWCVLHGVDIDDSHEWTTGPWKAEVDVMSKDMILDDAAELDGNWAMTHGSYVHILPLYDPDGFFPTLAEVVMDHSDEEYTTVIHAVIVGEVYEMIGKLRNMRASGNTAGLAVYIAYLACYGSWMIGLAHRHLYTSSSKMFTESLTLLDRPSGYDELCGIVMCGKLSDAEYLFASADAFWVGVEDWAKKTGIQIEQSLEELLH